MCFNLKFIINNYYILINKYLYVIKYTPKYI